MAKSLFEQIGLTAAASHEQIRNRCVAIANQYKTRADNGDLEAAVKHDQVMKIYAVLGNIEKRTAYDKFLKSSTSKAEHTAVTAGLAPYAPATEAEKANQSETMPTLEAAEARPGRVATLLKRISVIRSLGIRVWLRKTKLSLEGITLVSFAVFSLPYFFAIQSFGTFSYSMLGLLGCIFVLSYVLMRIDRPAYPPKGFALRLKNAIVPPVVFGTLGFFLSAIAFSALLITTKSPEVSADNKSTKSVGAPNAVEGKAAQTNSENVKNSCYSAGQSLATVYVANFSTLANADVLPSIVMREGCARKAAAAPDGSDCVYQCELGFRAVARAVSK